jgi:hypothetical protein
MPHFLFADVVVSVPVPVLPACLPACRACSWLKSERDLLRKYYTRDRRSLGSCVADGSLSSPTSSAPARPILIELASREFLDWWGHFVPKAMVGLLNCPVACRMWNPTTDRVSSPNRLPDIRLYFRTAQPAVVHSNQISAVLSIESQFGNSAHTEHLAAADALVSYSSYADVQTNYFYGLTEHCPGVAGLSGSDPRPCMNLTLPRGGPSGDFRTDALAAVFVSNCGVDYRQKYLSELMALIPIHSYGACLNNRPMPKGGVYKSRAAEKEAITVRVVCSLPLPLICQ